MYRLSLLTDHIKPSGISQSLTLTDPISHRNINVNIHDSCVSSKDLQKLSYNGKPLRTYDPRYMNTVSCSSKISFVGEKGVLEYRGYPVEELVRSSSFLEVAFLLIFGELPCSKEIYRFEKQVQSHHFLHRDIREIMSTFRYDAHPMGMMCSMMAALSTFYPEQNPSINNNESIYFNSSVRNKQIYRILGCLPTIAANAYRHRVGRSYSLPLENGGYVENFMFMLDMLNEKQYKPHPKLVRALQVILILHMEHEVNCSTAALRHLASAGVDIYTGISGAAGALYGVNYGGNNVSALKMLEQIGHPKNIPQFLQNVKNKEQILYGFGHPNYKNYDPRAAIIKNLAEQVFQVTGRQKLYDVAVELEKAALNDHYFKDRKLYPNVDFYTGVIYKAMGFPTDMFPVLFMLARTVGWLAHWKQFLDDPEKTLVAPLQHYTGKSTRQFVPIDQRSQAFIPLQCRKTHHARRNELSKVKY